MKTRVGRITPLDSGNDPFKKHYHLFKCSAPIFLKSFLYYDLMSNLYLDIILCSITYAILLGIIIWRKRKRRNSNPGDDDDGGLPVTKLPDLDLPPGVSLPTGGPSKKIEELEEALV